MFVCETEGRVCVVAFSGSVRMLHRLRSVLAFSHLSDIISTFHLLVALSAAWNALVDLL